LDDGGVAKSKTTYPHEQWTTTRHKYIRVCRFLGVDLKLCDDLFEFAIPAVTEQRLLTEAVLDDDGKEVEPATYETVEVTPATTVTKYRPWAVDKTAFTFHLIAGYQAQQKQIAALEARLSALEGNA